MNRPWIFFSILLFLPVTAFCIISNSPKTPKNIIQQQLAASSGSRKVELLLKLASLNNDSLIRANALAKEALNDAVQIADSYWIARAYTTLASIKRLNGSPDDSVAGYLQKAEKAFNASGHSRFHPDFYYEKAMYYFRKSDLHSAMAASQLALETAADENNLLVLANTYLLLSRIEKQQGNSRAFVENLMMAEKNYQKCDNKAAAGRALISIGLLYNDAGMTDVAQKVMIRATHLCEQTADSLFMAYLYCNTSGVYKSEPNGKQPYSILIKALNIFNKLHNDKGAGYAQNMLGLYSLGLGKYNDAQTWFRKTIQSKTRCGDWQGACFAACNIADLNLTLNKYEPVVQALTEARVYMKNAGDKLSEIVYYSTLGHFNQQDRNYPEAITNINQSLLLARQTHDANFYLSNLKTLSDLYHAMGDESKALDYSQRYNQANDSVHNAHNPIIQQEIENELNSNELIEKAVKERESRQPNYKVTVLRVAVIAGVIFLIALSVSAFGKRTTIPPLQTAGSDKEQSADLRIEKETVLKLDEHIQQSIWERIAGAMSEHKYYLRQDLTLHELASLLGTNTLYISRIINARTGLNFNSFINQYRVEEACKLLLADKHQQMSIEGIALTCGFKSKSAFNVAFKKLKGVTPTEYIDKQKLAI